MKEKNYRQYKLVKIARNDKFYWRAMYKDNTQNKILYCISEKEWQWLGVLIKDTDYLAIAEYKYKFGAMRRIVQDIQVSRISGKFEVYEEIIFDKKLELN